MSDQNELLPQKSWFSRNWKWFVPIISVVLIISLIIFMLSDVISGMGTAMADPELIGVAEKRAQSHPEVQSYFGKNVEAGTIIEGDVLLSDDGETIRATVPFKGDKGSGMMDIYAHRVDKQWVHDSIHVRLKKPQKQIIKLPN